MCVCVRAGAVILHCVHMNALSLGSCFLCVLIRFIYIYKNVSSPIMHVALLVCGVWSSAVFADSLSDRRLGNWGAMCHAAAV